jgi:hypothetical protein
MLVVVSCVLQILPDGLVEVSVTEPGAQKVNEPLALIVGVGGMGFTVIVVAADVALQPKELVCVTV